MGRPKTLHCKFGVISFWLLEDCLYIKYDRAVCQLRGCEAVGYQNVSPVVITANYYISVSLFGTGR